MWSRIKFKPVRFVKLRFIASGIALLLFIVMFTQIMGLLYSDKNVIKEITKADYESLQTDQLVWGKVSDVIASYEDDETMNYIVLTDNKKLMIFRAPFHSHINSEMKELYDGRISSVTFKGKVSGIKERSLSLLSLNVLTMSFISKYGITGNSHEYTTGHMIDITEYDNNKQIEILIAYGVCSVFMLVLIFLLLRKIINNAIYTIGVEKGKIQPELKVRKEDIKLDNHTDYYHEDDSEYFYVGTEYQQKDVKNMAIGSDKTQPEAEPLPVKQNSQPDDGLYYSSNVNEEGNFYVSTEQKPEITEQPKTNKKTDDYGYEKNDKYFHY